MHTKAHTYGVPRYSHGRIKRSPEEKRIFERESGYPHGRPGYVVDHIIPLSEGRDDPSYMQSQTVSEAKAKDKTERNIERFCGPRLRAFLRRCEGAGTAILEGVQAFRDRALLADIETLRGLIER